MNKSDISRDSYMLTGALKNKGYDWWWHSFTGYHRETGEKKSFFVEYFTINPNLGKDVPIFGQTEEKNLPSYVMVKAGAWGEHAKQLHGFYPIRAMAIRSYPIELEVEDNYLSEKNMYGSISVSEQEASRPELMCDAGSMSWNLKIDKKVAFHVGYGASRFFRQLNAFAMFWHAEGMKTEYCGTVVYDGETYDVDPEKSYGYADKNWGSDFTSPWVWISSCNLTSRITGRKLDNTVFDIGGGRPKVFGVSLDRRLLMDLYYEGKDYEFNFSKFWTGCRTKFNCYETDTEIIWKIKTETRTAIMKVVCRCKKSEMLLVNYEAPDGGKRHNRLWNGGTGTGVLSIYEKSRGKRKLIDILDFYDTGCEYGEYTK